MIRPMHEMNYPSVNVANLYAVYFVEIKYGDINLLNTISGFYGVFNIKYWKIL